MNTDERRHAMRRWLRAHPDATVDALAEAFAVSARTAHRDLAALRAAGAPIDSRPGRGGGLRLDPTADLPPLPLTWASVIDALWADRLHRAVGATPPLPGVDRFRTALEAHVDADALRALDAAADRVLVGAPAGDAPAAPVPSDLLPAYAEALASGRNLALTVDGAPVDIEPHGLLWRPPLWSLLVYDLGADALRALPLHRCADPRPLPTRFTPLPLTAFSNLAAPG